MNKIQKILLLFPIISMISCSSSKTAQEAETIRKLQNRQTEILKTLAVIKQKLIVLESKSGYVRNGLKVSSKGVSSNINKDKNLYRSVAYKEPDPSELPVVKLVPDKNYQQYGKRLVRKRKFLRTRKYGKRHISRKHTGKRVKLKLFGNSVKESHINPGGKVLSLGKFSPVKEPDLNSVYMSVPASGNVKGIYKKAMQHLKGGRYILAITLFNKIYRNYPKHSYADNALFWQGECYFRMKKFKKAAELFERVISEYPSGNKVPDAMLKKALCYTNLKLKIFAKKLLTVIINKYPSTLISAKASQMLKVMR